MARLCKCLLVNCFALAALSLQVSWQCTLAFSENGDMCGQICKENSVKVRISLKKELGAYAYVWDEAEYFLFQSAVAYAMRKSLDSGRGKQQPAVKAQHVVVCNKTQRVSFYVAVVYTNETQMDKQLLVRAIRLSRPRINRAFMLGTRTLEFVDVAPTLAPQGPGFRHAWMAAYGVVSVLIAGGMAFLFVDAWRKRHRRGGSLEPEATDEVVEDGVPTEACSDTHPNGEALTIL